MVKIKLEVCVSFWWLVIVTLLVAFGFLPQNFGKWWIIILLENECSLSGGDNLEVVGKLNPYL